MIMGALCLMNPTRVHFDVNRLSQSNPGKLERGSYVAALDV